ncbi:hypothetical protein WJX77_012082 [Trebouxia sp. C0004]
MPDTTGRVNQEDVSFLGLAYEWCTIQGQKRLEQPGHYRQFNGVDRKLQSPQYLGLLQLLLEFNASPAKGVQGLFQAIALSADTAAIRQLLLHGLDANATLSDGNTLLHLLVMAPDIEWPSADEDDIAQARSRQIEVAVTFLIEKGASPLARNNQQKTPVDSGESCSDTGLVVRPYVSVTKKHSRGAVSGDAVFSILTMTHRTIAYPQDGAAQDARLLRGPEWPG